MNKMSYNTEPWSAGDVNQKTRTSMILYNNESFTPDELYQHDVIMTLGPDQ